MRGLKMSKDWADVKIGVKRDTHKDLKDLKYDLRVDTFDEVISELIRKYKGG
jgi:hypothetical protein